MITKDDVRVSDKTRLKLIVTKHKSFQPKEEEDAFYELCFCICSPQTSFETNSELNKDLREVGFFRNFVHKDRLEEFIYKTRFYHRKADFLIDAKNHWREIWYHMEHLESDWERREYLVNQVRGLGYKTASHFLRNVRGCEHFAILDTHVCKFLRVSVPHSPVMYKVLESNFQQIAEKAALTPLELDMLIFSQYTGLPLEEIR